MKFKFGQTATDVITGFTGVLTGYCTYISGCSQWLISPKSKDNKHENALWVDEQRIVISKKVKQIVLDNTETPGADISAPVR